MTVMLAAIAATVSSYTHQDDITFGLIVSRRSSAALERMLGLFVEDVAYRVVVPDPNDAAEVTRRAAAALAGVLEHPMYPYERLNETCQQRRPTPNGELFSLIVNWLPPVTVSSAAVRTRFMTMPRQSGTKHYLSLRLRDEGSLHVDAKYRTAMYSDEFVRTFVQDILRAADRMATHLCS
jgi:non-ribosomal peptide synthetase component F